MKANPGTGSPSHNPRHHCGYASLASFVDSVSPSAAVTCWWLVFFFFLHYLMFHIIKPSPSMPIGSTESCQGAPEMRINDTSSWRFATCMLGARVPQTQLCVVIAPLTGPVDPKSRLFTFSLTIPRVQRNQTRRSGPSLKVFYCSVTLDAEHHKTKKICLVQTASPCFCVRAS